jgi:hypothetical protein
MDPKEQAKADLARLRHERWHYTDLAWRQRKLAVELKQQHRFLESLKAYGKAEEYKSAAIQTSERIRTLRDIWDLR